MTQPAPTPSYRLKIACADERDFLEHFAPKYVSSGIVVPSKNPRPVGTRVRVKIELRNGQVLVSGDAIVTSRAMPDATDRPGMTMRLTALHPESFKFELSPAASGAAARPTPPPPAAPPTSGATPLDDLFLLDDEPAEAAPDARPADAEPGIAPSPTPIPDRGRVAIGAMRRGPPEPDVATPPAGPLEAAPEKTPRAAEGHRFVIWIALALAIVGGIATTVALRAPRARVGAAAEAKDAARVAEELRLADSRLMEGRLAGAGGDTALDHLLAARAVAPEDPRVTSRLRLLADKFEQLGERALARRNLGEAAVHYQVALRADPGREGIRRKLAEIAASTESGTPSR